MVTDDERREVADRLRRSWPSIADESPVNRALRFYLAVNSAIFDPRECDKKDTIDMLDRLADLIEPGDTSQSCRDTVACDREALLALAEKARKLGDEEGGPASYAVRCTFRVFARDIYKALGEVVS